jgi:hypothetical protein
MKQNILLLMLLLPLSVAAADEPQVIALWE